MTHNKGRPISPRVDALRACLHPSAPNRLRLACKTMILDTLKFAPYNPGLIAATLGIERRAWERLRAGHLWIGRDPRAWARDDVAPVIEVTES